MILLIFWMIDGIIQTMKKPEKELHASLVQITLLDFLASYNKNMPPSYPRASAALLRRFQEVHPSLFKNGDLWTLDQHRKKFFEWLPQNLGTS